MVVRFPSTFVRRHRAEIVGSCDPCLSARRWGGSLWCYGRRHRAEIVGSCDPCLSARRWGGSLWCYGRRHRAEIVVSATHCSGNGHPMFLRNIGVGRDRDGPSSAFGRRSGSSACRLGWSPPRNVVEVRRVDSAGRRRRRRRVPIPRAMGRPVERSRVGRGAERRFGRPFPSAFGRRHRAEIVVSATHCSGNGHPMFLRNIGVGRDRDGPSSAFALRSGSSARRLDSPRPDPHPCRACGDSNIGPQVRCP